MTMTLTTRAAIAIAIVCAAPARAAADSWTWDDDASEAEVRNFYKTAATALQLPPGLVELAGVPRRGLLWTHATRTWGHVVLRDRLELQAGWQLAALLASDPAFTAGAGLGSNVPVNDAPRAHRRLVDFDPVLLERGGLTMVQDLDLLAAKVTSSRADVTIGRQVLSWGSGHLWNPTDLLSPFAPTDVDREVRRGVDALRVSIPLAATAQVDVLWLPQPDLRDHGGVARAQVNVRGFDLAPSLAKYVRDVVAGLDVTGDVGPAGVHAEAAWTTSLDQDERFVRAVAGADLRPRDDLVVSGEYYFNGWGAADPAGYLAVLQSDRVVRGEGFGAGRHYLGLIAAWTSSEIFSMQGVAITNLADPSVLFVPSLEYSPDQQSLVRAAAYLPLGRAPDAGGLRSEYGAAPLAAFVQIAIYLL